MSERMTVSQWHTRLRTGVDGSEVKYILWDWQNENVERLEELDILLKRIEILATENASLQMENKLLLDRLEFAQELAEKNATTR